MTDKKVLMPRIKDIDPNVLAAEICSVQPMPDHTLADLYNNALSREELVAKGYKPVSNLGLMWIKDDKND